MLKQWKIRDKIIKAMIETKSDRQKKQQIVNIEKYRYQYT